MKRFLQYISLSLLLIMIFQSGELFAQARPLSKAQADSVRNSRSQQFKQLLNLSDVQQDSIQALQKEYSVAMKKLLAKKIPVEERKSLHATIRQNHEDGMKRVLTETQYKKLLELRQENRKTGSQ